MMEVRYGNFLYFFFLALLFAMTYFSEILCRRMGKEFAYKFILTILWTNFALHYVKQLNPSYLADFPYALKRSTPENLCALLITLAPFIFMWGGNWTKDYMFFMGIISGLATYLNPSGALNVPLDNANTILEVLRFYLCHAPLVICSLLMVTQGFHKPNYHRIWALPITFLGFETIIFLNELALKFSGLVPMDWVDLWSRNYRNGAMVFGPFPGMDKALSWLYPILVPSFLRYTSEVGVTNFIPVLWLILPVYLVAVPLIFLFYIPFEHHHMGCDFLMFKQKRRLARLSRAYLKAK